MPIVFTHGGSAHRDDFLACAVVLAMEGPGWTIRRDVTYSSAKADASDIVIDVGRVYAPELRRFDHHQDIALPCSLVMVLKHYGLLDAAYTWYPWLELTDIIDTSGPAAACSWMHVPSQVLARTRSPVETAILSMFEAQKEIKEGDVLFSVLVGIGRNIVDGLAFRRERLALLKQRAVVEWRDGKAFAIYFLDDVPKPETSMSTFRYECAGGAVAGVVREAGQRGWRLFRFGTAHNVDFRRLEVEPDVSFVHASGFMAIARAECSATRLRDLVHRAAGVPVVDSEKDKL